MTNNKPPFYQDENPKPIFSYEDTDDSVDELDLFDMLDEEEE